MKRTKMKPVSDKKRAYRKSTEGRAAMEYMHAVKGLPCVICGHPTPSDAHHIISERFGSRKSSDWDVIPLCKSHHQDGPEAIHNGKASWQAKHGLDTSYVERVRGWIKTRYPGKFDLWI